MKKKFGILLAATCAIIMYTSCIQSKRSYKNPILDKGCYPHAIFKDGKYYYTMQTADTKSIVLWCTDDITKLDNCEKKTVWLPTDSAGNIHIWSPEIHYINHKWYIYYEADDGNTDNHHIFVIENPSPNPMKGKFTMKGTIVTNEEWNWSIHPSVFSNKGKLYLIWSGWQKRRAEEETQCIYIGLLKNPWTLASKRVKISQPVYEWERQWINPDGQRSAYPIYVNENPEAFFSKDGRHICITYSSSGCWTLYNNVGMLYADVNSNLLSPASWYKRKEPVFMPNIKDSLFGTSDLCVIPTPSGKDTYFLYEGKHLEAGTYQRDIRLQKMTWDRNGMPVFGTPQPLNQIMDRPK